MTEQALVLRNVRRRLGNFHLRVDELSLDRGFVLGLVGRNGAGKSTTIKILLNLIYPETGQVEVLGCQQPLDEIAIKQRVGYVSEVPSFYSDMTVAWTARLVSRYYASWDDVAYRGYLRKFDLDPQKKVKQLSKGMRMRLALTLALSHQPELLVLDEPTSGLDPVARRQLLIEILSLVQDDRRAVVFSSHISPDVEQVADHIAILNDGRVIEQGSKESLLDRWKRVTGEWPVQDSVDGAGGVPFRSVVSEGRSFTGITDRYSPAWLEKLRRQGVANVSARNMNLDDILISLTGEGG